MRKFVTAFLSTASLFALMGLAPAISQAAPCDGVGSEQPFTDWHDQESYVLVSGGDFESAADGWTLSDGAAVMPGGNTLRPDSSANSLSLPAGSSATSPAICVGKGDPVARIFMRSTTADTQGRAGLKVEVVYLDSNGDARKVKKAGWLRGTGDWAPSRRFGLAQGQFSHPKQAPPTTAPGQPGDTHGQPGGVAGQSDTPHGQSDVPHGQSDTPHGQSDTPHGQGGADNGQSGTAPDQPGSSGQSTGHGQGGHGQGGHGHGGHGHGGHSHSSRTGSIELRFTAGDGADWQIDDVFVDPRARR